MKALGGKITGLLGGILQNDALQPLQVPTGNKSDSMMPMLIRGQPCPKFVNG